MLKQLGIAAACGIAVYGLAHYLHRHVVIDTSGHVADLLATAASLEEGAGPGETAASPCTDAASTDGPSDQMQATPCP